MSDSPTITLAGIPLRFVPRGDDTTRGEWLGRDTARRVYVRIAGDERGPFPAYATTASAIVANLDEITRAIDRHVEALGPDGMILFGSRPAEGFRTAICGFGAGFTGVDAIAVMDPSNPELAMLSVVTGEPDGYVTYRVTLDRQVPIHIDAVFS